MTLFELRADYIRRNIRVTEERERLDRMLKADRYEYEAQRNMDLIEHSRLGALKLAYETIEDELSRLSF